MSGDNVPDEFFLAIEELARKDCGDDLMSIRHYKLILLEEVIRSLVADPEIRAAIERRTKIIKENYLQK